MKVPLFDLRPQHAPIAAELKDVFGVFLDAPAFILGEHVQRFEQAVCEFLGVEHAVGVSSGTDALVCALLALGVGAGDEVITSPFTFVATGEAILRVGAVPKFADIEPSSFNIDPVAIKALITPKTRAVIPVHLFGRPANTQAIRALAQEHGLVVLEDAAQAFGAKYQGRCVGTLADMAAFSFFPSKPLGGWGDGGMVVTPHARWAERCRELRSHGKNPQGRFETLGGNYRLDALQAAILYLKLAHVPAWQAERTALAHAYNEGLQGVAQLVLPSRDSDSVSAYSLYTIRVTGHGAGVQRRDMLKNALLERGIETGVYYSLPLHQQELFRGSKGNGAVRCPVAEQVAAEVLSLPLFPGLAPEQQRFVIEQVREQLR